MKSLLFVARSKTIIFSFLFCPLCCCWLELGERVQHELLYIPDLALRNIRKICEISSYFYGNMNISRNLFQHHHRRRRRRNVFFLQILFLRILSVWIHQSFNVVFIRIHCWRLLYAFRFFLRIHKYSSLSHSKFPTFDDIPVREGSSAEPQHGTVFSEANQKRKKYNLCWFTDHITHMSTSQPVTDSREK